MSDIQRIGLRHDDLADWESGNPTLVVDETVLIDDTRQLIRGDGSAFNTSYTSVGYLAPHPLVGWHPNHYSRDDRIKIKNNTAERNTIVISPTSVLINSSGYVLGEAIEIDISASASWDTTTGIDYTIAANRAGKDFYIYACTPSTGTTPDFVLSANATVPGGYTASNSRKVGGFHALTAAAGTLYDYDNDDGELALLDDVYVSHNITGTKHWLDGYLAGDPLPFSLWDLLHRPVSDPEGMVYDPATNKWVDIYLASWDGTAEKLVSVDGGTIADGASTPAFHQYKFQQYFPRVRKTLPDQGEFVSFSLGSPQGENIAGDSDLGTTGGHAAVSGQRIVSLIGVEDATGVLWQWGREGGATNDVTDFESAFDSNDKNVAGQHGEAPNRPLFGGYWEDGARCGSRGSRWTGPALNLSSSIGARGVAEPYGGRA